METADRVKQERDERRGEILRVRDDALNRERMPWTGETKWFPAPSGDEQGGATPIEKGAQHMETAELPPVQLSNKPGLRHPARYSPAVLDNMAVVLEEHARLLGRRLDVLDCFAGDGQRLAAHRMFAEHDFVGVELVEAWAAVSGWVRHGNARTLDGIDDRSFDVVCTSPVYPNRLRDNHKPRELCTACSSSGSTPDGAQCVKCNGTGARKYVRRSYTYDFRATIGDPTAELDRDNAGRAANTEYWAIHRDVVRQWTRVLRPNGLAVVDMGDSIATIKGEARSNNAVQAWADLLVDHGFVELARIPNEMHGLRYGSAESRDLRTGHSVLLVYQLGGE